MTGFFNTVRQDLASGLGLLTRLPVMGLLSPAQRNSTAAWPLARSLWCWPLVGAGIGAITGGLGYVLQSGLHLATLPAVTLALAAQTALTGGFHEDGLADMADSYGANTRARKLEIMRDSRVGSYGVIALCLSFLVRAGALAALPAATLIPALALAGLLARAALLWVPACLPPARPDGLARSLSPLPKTAFGVAQGITVVAYALWAWWWAGAVAHTALALMLPPAGAALAVLCLSHAAKKHLGGYTGDVLGATATLADCLTLAALTASVHP
ncbi:hypothetical protein HK27_05090 [Acetobacter orientalis]|uniref:adenosylcobinamide-GDP ribazoletransferase n=1 Tax=Acetobacter orientalis TaxID=146474 RepID=UPI000A38EB05|nr:adenosylcobinamide-GDP ribazoletransferase [Acetobacter orientalis]OUJ16230.1 hypothetical protein HK27_05090 [Acetobacter orientalis]